MFNLDKQASRKAFDGSNGLFEACWRKYRQLLASAIDNPSCQQDVDEWLEGLAAEMVNNSGSKFYIYG